MSRYIETLVGKNDIVRIEVDDETLIPVQSADVLKASPSMEEIAEKAQSAFTQVLTITRSLAKEFSANFRKISNPPKEVSLEFGIKVDANAGTLIAKAGTEANFTVKLVWQKGR